MNVQRERYFDPEAPGMRGLLGILLGIFGLILHRVRHGLVRTQEYVADLHPRIRGILMIMTSLIVLLFVLYIFAQALAGILLEDPTFMGAEMLVAPHNLEDRALPPTGAEPRNLFPSSMGPLVASSEAAKMHSFNFVHQCLLGLHVVPKNATVEPVNPKNEAPDCPRRYEPVNVVASRYRDEDVIGKSADLVIAKFATKREAQLTMIDMLAYARSVGDTGNFSVGGIGPVDFFYNQTMRDWSVFTWSHEEWVFSIGTQQGFGYLERALRGFPY